MESKEGASETATTMSTNAYTINSDEFEEADDALRYAVLESLKTRSGVEEFVNDLSMHMLMEKDTRWGEMLSAAPRALCSIAQCVALATSSREMSVLKLPASSELQYQSLRANLTHCSDLGRLALEEAHKKMSRVANISDRICRQNGTVDLIIRDLDDEHLVEYDLPTQLANLRQSSQECVTIAVEVNAKFMAWREFALKLREACTTASSESEHRTVQLENKIVYVQSQKGHQIDQIAIEQRELERLEVERDTDRKILGDAVKNLPTGISAIMYDVFGSALESAVSFTKSWESIPLAAKLLHYYKNSMPAQPERPPSPETLDPDDDFGLWLAGQMKHDIDSLDECLHRGPAHSPDFGVNFKQLFGHSSSGALIDVMLNKLQEYKSEAFSEADNANATKNTTEALEILEDVFKVSEDIHVYYEEQQSMGQLPSEVEIEDWKDRVHRARKAIGILSDERTYLKKKREKQHQDQKEARSREIKPSKKWAYLKYMRENAKMSQEMLQKSQNQIAEQVERQRQSDRKFNEIQLELMKLNHEEYSMHKVVNILERCILNLTDFQDHVQQLVSFFDGLENFVKEIHERHAVNLVNTIENDQNMNQDPSVRDKFGVRAREEMKRRILLDAVSLQGHYAVSRELSAVYVEVSKKHILPGVKIVERLGLTQGRDGMDINDKVQKISDYAQDAVDDITHRTAKRQMLLRSKLYDEERQIEEVDRFAPEQGDGST